jgi:uncharacterized protein (TIGR00730 family)
MKRVCVFAGARSGADGRYTVAAQDLGREIGRRNLELIYGGSPKGLMGACAASAAIAGARVVGISARQVRTAEATTSLPHHHEYVVAETMQERRAAMFDRSDAVIALPGGLGTLEELMEIWSWKHLGLHDKPIGLLNVDDFWSPLLNFIEGLRAQEFVRPARSLDPVFAADAASLLSLMAQD